MCGIAGLVSRAQISSEQRAQVKQMNAALAHRGPDGAGEFHDSHLTLAMRRLSIIDVSGGQQPLYNESGSLAVVCNGEIYNYVELRDELRGRGHRLSTQSDVETLVHLYEDHGLDFVDHLRGMFAVALWDKERQRLILARDRMGEKPLYLWQSGDQLAFASEIKSLIQILPKGLEVDPSALDLYLHLQYVPEPQTLLRDVHKLPAAHLCIVDVASWQIKYHRYWDVANVPAIQAEPIQRLRDEMDAVTTLTLRSDVPVGVALSGGLDSGGIAALAAPRYRGTLHAFSVGYPDRPKYDEREQARDLAERLGLPFHEIELSTERMIDLFPALVAHADDPIADIAAYGYYAVTQLAREHNVPVMLSGIGGDELFWGYAGVNAMVRENEIKSQLRFVSPLLSQLPWDKTNRFVRLRRLCASPANRLLLWETNPDLAHAQQRLPTFYSKTFFEQLAPDNCFAPQVIETGWEDVPMAVSKVVFDTWLVSNCIALGDRLSMAWSVELRLPLVDYRLVEVVMGLRKAHPDHRLPPKTWLKQVLRGSIPDEVLDRPKQGFNPPVDEWTLGVIQRYGDKVQNGFLASKGIVRGDEWRVLKDQTLARQCRRHLAFKVVLLEVWCRHFLA